MKKVYAFQNFVGGGEGPGIGIAEDGTVLAEHWSSNPYWAEHDLGARSNWKHELYAAHYPEGFEVEFVPADKVDAHEGLQRALALNTQQAEVSEVSAA
jgi:hypothetical protein